MVKIHSTVTTEVKIRSTVITEVKDYADEGILIPHEAIRLMMERMQKALTHLEGNTDKVKPLVAFYKYYNNYFRYLTEHHHEAEEKIYIPWINSKEKLPGKISDDHKTLMQKLNSLSELGKNITVNTSTEEANKHYEELKPKLNELVTAMLAHLSEEEETFPDAVRNNFTQEQEKVIIQQIVKGLGIGGNKKFLPVIYEAMAEWGGPEKASGFRNSLPFPVRALWWLNWGSAYKKDHKGLLLQIHPDTLK